MKYIHVHIIYNNITSYSSTIYTINPNTYHWIYYSGMLMLVIISPQEFIIQFQQNFISRLLVGNKSWWDYNTYTQKYANPTNQDSVFPRLPVFKHLPPHQWVVFSTSSTFYFRNCSRRVSLFSPVFFFLLLSFQMSYSNIPLCESHFYDFIKIFIV